MSKIARRSLLQFAAATGAALFAAATARPATTAFAHARQSAESRQARKSLGESAPFDPASARLPPNYAGTDLKALLRALEARSARLAKDEFETTAQHKERVRAEESKPVYGSLRLDSLLAAVMDAESAYDADAELMTVTADVPAYLGELFFSERGHGSYGAKIKLDIPTARRVKPELRALLLFNLTPPYATGGRLTAGLREVWFFDNATGEVLVKAAQSVAAEADRELDEIAKLIETGRDEEALLRLRDVLRVTPMSARAYLMTGKIYIKRGETASAMSQLKAAIFWDSGRALVEPHVLLARIYLERGERAGARVRAERFANRPRPPGSHRAPDSARAQVTSLHRRPAQV